MKRSKLLAIAVGALLGGGAMAQETSSGEPQGTTSTETDIAAYSAIPGPSGLEVGFRVGYALALGDVQSGTSFNDFSKNMVPLQVDLGYRIDGNWFAGAYFQYGFTGIKDPVCDNSGVDCSSHDFRFGIEGQYHLMPSAVIDPWVGLGVGYEFYHLNTSASGTEASETLRGWEFVNVSLGADYKLAPSLGVGPFIGLSVGEFTDASLSVTGLPDQSGSIDDKAVHLWLTFGMRGVFDVPL